MHWIYIIIIIIKKKIKRKAAIHSLTPLPARDARAKACQKNQDIVLFNLIMK